MDNRLSVVACLYGFVVCLDLKVRSELILFIQKLRNLVITLAVFYLTLFVLGFIILLILGVEI